MNYKNITIEELFDKLFFKTRIQFIIVKDKIVLKHFDGKLYQNVRGRIIDAENKLPLMIANIAITSTSPQMGTYTDEDGYFVIYDVPIGRHDIQASILSYQAIAINNVLVKSAKELVINLEMIELVTSIDEIIITPAKEITQPINSMATGSVRKFSTEETQRYAAGMSDPSRMTQSYPGTFMGGDGRPFQKRRRCYLFIQLQVIKRNNIKCLRRRRSGFWNPLVLWIFHTKYICQQKARESLQFSV